MRALKYRKTAGQRLTTKRHAGNVERAPVHVAKGDTVRGVRGDDKGKEGTVMRAAFTLNDVSFMATDSPAVHAFDFTPSMSIFVECDSDAELDRVFAALSEGGKTLMPLGNYGFSKKFGWCNDRFGVSWQLNLP